MAQQEQRGGEIGRNQAVSGRPVVLPEVYKGDSSWMDWAEHFESVAAVNGWKDEEKLLWLRVRLVGRAATAFKRVPEGARASYARCLEALKERFDPSSKRELYLAELMGRKKLRSEDWATFAEDLKQLVERAYPDLQEDAREQLALTHYLGQLEPQQLAFSVKQKRPKTVDEAVSATLEMESYLLPKGSRVAQVAEGYMPIEPVSLVHAQNDAVMTLLQQVVDRMDQLEAKVASLTQSQQEVGKVRGEKPNTSNSPPRGPIVCHRCKKEGHLARGCVAPRPQQRQSNPGNGRPSV